MVPALMSFGLGINRGRCQWRKNHLYVIYCSSIHNQIDIRKLHATLHQHCQLIIVLVLQVLCSYLFIYFFKSLLVSYQQKKCVYCSTSFVNVLHPFEDGVHFFICCHPLEQSKTDLHYTRRYKDLKKKKKVFSVDTLTSCQVTAMCNTIYTTKTLTGLSFELFTK